MENLNDLKNLWTSCAQSAPAEGRLNDRSLKQIVNTHIKKERQLLFNYALKTSVWIFFITAAFGHSLIRFWGDWNLTALSVVGLLLYIPFTAIFIQRFKRFFGLEVKVNANEELSVYQRLKKKQEDIMRFYRFKVYFDILMIPVCCVWIMLAINAFAFSTAVQVHWIFNGLVLLIALILFIAVTIQDNQRYFRGPLRQIVKILNDMES